MKQEVQNTLDTLEKPLRYISDQDYKNIHVVKNLSEHVQEQCKKANQLISDFSSKSIISSIEQSFYEYEVVENDQKKKLIQEAIEKITMLRGQSGIAFEFVESDHPLQSLDQIKEAYQKILANIQFAKGVGPKMAQKFYDANIHTLYDLMHILPYRYEDRMHLKKIGEIQDDEMATFLATVTYSGTTFYRGVRKKVFEVMVEDETGSIRLKWFYFHQASFEKRFKKNQKIIVTGKVKNYRNQKQIHHPDFEIYAGDEENLSFGKIVPVYSEIKGVFQKTLRKILYNLSMSELQNRVELLPKSIAKKYGFLPPWKALFYLHQPPKNLKSMDQDLLKRHLAFEELFFYALAYLVNKKNLKSKGIEFKKKSERSSRLKKSLPFELTLAQEKALQEIEKDMESPNIMNRLIQGDVGSGKTIVAFMAALKAIDCGYQVAMMAPTEILANQLFQNIQSWAEVVNINVGSLLGKHSKQEKEVLSKSLALGEIDMVVGTHSLIEDYVQFKNLGLVIVDEQHRFGVKQKEKIREKSARPDVLIMSATPIPRSLAMSLFGDIDVSIIDQMPKNRKPVVTLIKKDQQRAEVYQAIRKTVEQGDQVFIVYPLVEASQYLDAKDAVSMHELFDKEVFAKLEIGLLHGQLPSDEKQEIMHRFQQGKIQVLVATTVIEVGIDIPNATLIVIEHPERFGLAQLHQLRGRVGRGSKQGKCILMMAEQTSIMAQHRLKNFSNIYDGFALAEMDLKLRGPGDFFGVAQSGMPDFSMAEFPRDMDLLEITRREASQIVQGDPQFENPEHQHLMWVLNTLWKDRVKYIDVA